MLRIEEILHAIRGLGIEETLEVEGCLRQSPTPVRINRVFPIHLLQLLINLLEAPALPERGVQKWTQILFLSSVSFINESAFTHTNLLSSGE